MKEADNYAVTSNNQSTPQVTNFFLQDEQPAK